tara:strand:+ start:19 stop:3183 length:3165 start_codon:yes stop_codon:yes gene_type:complete
MLRKTKLTSIALAVAMSIGISSVAIAQETSSSIGGTVLSQNGQSVSNATVTITDTRTGAVKVISTNETGRYNLRGMRVGGPYTVEVMDQAGNKIVEQGVFLNLGETKSLNLDLGAQEEESLETITVSGRVTNATYGSSGPVANFGLADLESAPAINRDIKDLVRIDPRIYIDEAGGDGIQCAGANSRFNSLTVDGIRTNDNFGLNSNGYPTIRIPFSYDSIDQVAVELAPFDVQYGGFTACNINAVTKSGTNEWHGGAFFDYTNDSLRGDELEGDKLTVGKFNEKRFGFNVGGALIKDKLFFFGSYEKLEGATLFDRGAADSNQAVQVAGVSQAQLDRIEQIANDIYGYDPGAFTTSIPVEDEKIMLKLDWQINADHRASLVYNYNDGNTIRESDGDSDEYEFSNHYYEQGGKLESYVGSVYSDWSDNFSTELRIGTSDYDANVMPLGGTDFGEVQISTENDGARATVYLGADDSRHANKLSYSTDTFKLAGTYTTGDHIITGGYEFESLDVFNLFVQEAEGEYRFGSIDDFEAGTPSRITYENAAVTNNVNDAAAAFSYDIHTAYIQDEYYWLDQDMTITYGLRYDWYASDDLPPENPFVEETYGFSNQQNLDGIDLLQPRLGVNWMLTEQLEVRGGVGLYSGGNPNVWLSNNYSNNGVIQVEQQDRSGTSVFDMAFTGEGRPIYDIPQDLFDGVANGTASNRGLNFQDPDFEIPSEWKYAIGGTYTFENDYVLMVDYLYSKKQNAAIISDVSRVLTDETAPDGRPIYTSNGRSQDYLLTNVDGDSGDSTSISFALSKSFDFGLDASLSYAYTDSSEVSPMTSSVAFSNYTSTAVFDPQNPGVATSNFEIPHRVTLRLSYKHEFFDGYNTSFSLFGTANEGRPYSYTFDNRDFNDGDNFLNDALGQSDSNDRQLVYIPTIDDASVIYGEGFDLDAFNAFIDAEGLTRGEIMDRNSVNSDWWVKFDLKINQEFAGFYEGHKGNAFVVIENLGNLLNDDWGVLKEASFPRQQSVVDASINDAGQYVYNSFIVPSGQTRVADASLWEVRVGVNYKF